MTSLRALLVALVVAMLAIAVLAETPANAVADANKNPEMLRGAPGAQPNAMPEAVAGVDEASQLPPGLSLTGEQEALESPDEGNKEMFYGYRRRFYYPHYGRGYYGWRYPIGYWNLYGPRYYGGYCPYGHYYGGWYYC